VLHIFLHCNFSKTGHHVYLKTFIHKKQNQENQE